MKAILKLEIFSDDRTQYLRLQKSIIAENLGNEVANMVIGKIPCSQYVAEITGLDIKYGYKRTFLKSNKDYKKSNGIGSRGIFACYLVESGKFYEVQERTSWKKQQRYYCTVSSKGDIINVNKDDVSEWLKLDLE